MLVTVGAFLWPLSVVDALVLAVVLTVYVVLSPPLAFWAGGVPRRLDGSRPHACGRCSGGGAGSTSMPVTAAAIGGSRSRRGRARTAPAGSCSRTLTATR